MNTIGVKKQRLKKKKKKLNQAKEIDEFWTY